MTDRTWEFAADVSKQPAVAADRRPKHLRLKPRSAAPLRIGRFSGTKKVAVTEVVLASDGTWSLRINGVDSPEVVLETSYHRSMSDAAEQRGGDSGAVDEFSRSLPQPNHATTDANSTLQSEQRMTNAPRGINLGSALSAPTIRPTDHPNPSGSYVQPNIAQVAAAQLWAHLDELDGMETSPLIRRVAEGLPIPG